MTQQTTTALLATQNNRLRFIHVVGRNINQTGSDMEMLVNANEIVSITDAGGGWVFFNMTASPVVLVKGTPAEWAKKLVKIPFVIVTKEQDL